MSTHEVPIVEIKLEPHPNADSLSIVRVFGFTCCAQTKGWKDGDLAAYIPPDFEVDANRPEFSFLKDPSRPDKNWVRVKAKKLRGIISMGILIPAPEGMKPGDNALEALGVRRYESPVDLTSGGEDERGPEVYAPVYDVEDFRRYGHLFPPKTECFLTEKIDGSSGKYLWKDNRLWVGSRTRWKKYNPSSFWWRAVERNPWIEEFCKSHPEFVMYGEVFGNTQLMKYGANKADMFFRAFDLLRGSEWVGYDELIKMLEAGKDLDFEKWVPITGYDTIEDSSDPSVRVKAILEKYSDAGNTRIGPPQIAEGNVIRPRYEMTCPEIGRLQLKIVSEAYLQR